VSSRNFTLRSKAPFSGLDEPSSRCEEGANGRDRADGVPTGKLLRVILEISAPPPYPRPNGGGPEGGSKIVRLRHLAWGLWV
jgi:hypothetical protein